MSIEVICVQCGASHRVNRNMAGRRVRCPQCDTAVHVPEHDLGPPDTAEASDLSDAPETAVDTEPAVETEAAPIDPAANGTADHAQPPTVPGAVDDLQFHVDAHADEPAISLTDSAILRPPAESVATAEPIETHIMVLDDESDQDEVLVRGKRSMDEIDMTPMVDVTFLLLIFFMVTAAFSLQKSIQMPRQQTDAPSINTEELEDELDVVEVQVDEFGSFLVMAPDWERETPGKQNLITALREAIAGDRDGMKLDVKVHELAKLHALVDALDAGTIAGFSDLKVTQVEEFE